MVNPKDPDLYPENCKIISLEQYLKLFKFTGNDLLLMRRLSQLAAQATKTNKEGDKKSLNCKNLNQIPLVHLINFFKKI